MIPEAQTALLHFGKSRLEVRDLDWFVMHETVKALRGTGFLFLNLGADLGLEGLRQVKQDFRPSEVATVYTVRLQT